MLTESGEKLELAAAHVSEPDWVDGKIPMCGQIAEPSEQIIFTFWSLMYCYALKLLRKTELVVRGWAACSSPKAAWLLLWGKLKNRMTTCHVGCHRPCFPVRRSWETMSPAQTEWSITPLSLHLHLRVPVGCDGCVTMWSTYATSKCASW